MEENENAKATANEHRDSEQRTFVDHPPIIDSIASIKTEKRQQDRQDNAVENSASKNTTDASITDVNRRDNPTRKKQWGEYILEFFMLFLAVFLGFIAENIRENFGERQREREYVEEVVRDIKDDTTNLRISIGRNILKNQVWDSLMLLVHTDLSLPENAKKFYSYFIRGSLMPLFIANDASIVQLKSGGNLRLIRNRAVSDSILNYDSWNKRILAHNEIFGEQSNKTWDASYSIIHGWVLSDTAYVDYFNRKVSEKIPPPLSLNPQQVQVFFGELARTLLITQVNRRYMAEQQNRSERLITFLQQQYDLDNK